MGRLKLNTSRQISTVNMLMNLGDKMENKCHLRGPLHFKMHWTHLVIIKDQLFHLLFPNIAYTNIER